MTTPTAMIDPTELAALRTALAEANQRVDVLRSDAIRLTNMVDSLMRQRDAAKAEIDQLYQTRAANREKIVALAAEVAVAQSNFRIAQADAALWRERTLSTRDILNRVEDVSDDPSPANVQALVDAFNAWRMLVERGVPVAWGVAGELGDGEAGENAWA